MKNKNNVQPTAETIALKVLKLSIARGCREFWKKRGI